MGKPSTIEELTDWLSPQFNDIRRDVNGIKQDIKLIHSDLIEHDKCSEELIHNVRRAIDIE